MGVARLHPGHRPRDQQLGAEADRLPAGALAQLVAAEAAGKAEVVLDPGGGACLAAAGRALDQQRPEPLRRAVHRGRQSGGTAADDHDVVGVVVGLGLEPERLRQAAERGRLQPRAVGEHDGRGRDARRAAAWSRAVGWNAKAVRHAIARQEFAQVVAGRVVGVSDDRDQPGLVLDLELAEATHPRRHRLGDLGAQHLALTHQLQEVRPLEPEHAAGLGGAEVGDRGRAQQQRHLAEIVARTVGREPLLPPAHHLEDVDVALEEPVEPRGLALHQEPFVLPQAQVGRARGQGGALAFGDFGEERDAAQQVGSDHVQSTGVGFPNGTRVRRRSGAGAGRRPSPACRRPLGIRVSPNPQPAG